MRYAVEVARLGSLNKASESLLTAQPNISRSIKELEAELNIRIFERSAKGMILTDEGEEFISYAKRILSQLDEVEASYKNKARKKLQFSISVPRACYISEAFVEFSKKLGTAPCELYYKETNSQKAINNILNMKYKLGIIRYAETHDKYFKELFEEKGLSFEIISEFSYRMLVSRHSPLAEKSRLTADELADYIEVAHADPFVPTIPSARIFREEISENVTRKIFVYERASRYELLSQNPSCFMWVSPTPRRLLDKYELTELACDFNRRKYRDVLIYKKDEKLSELDKLFITELCAAKRRIM